MLLKIPLLASQAVWFYIAVTSPTSAPPPKEQTGHRYWVESNVANAIFLVGGLDIAKAIIGAASLAEIAVILANEFPSHPVSATALRTLLFPPGTQMPSTMRVTAPVLAGSLLMTAGGVLRRWCYRTLDKFFTYHLSIRENHQLVTAGPYAYVRHPAYTGGLMTILGGLFALLGSGGWVRESGVLGTLVGKAAVGMWVPLMSFIGWLIVFRRCRAEDRMLKERFGKEWEEWAKRVPYKLLPGVF